MNIKTICFGAMALSMMTGASLAAQGDGSPLNDPAKMGVFYTDKDMKTMKGPDDFKAAWMALTDEDRASYTTACMEAQTNNATGVDPQFCSTVQSLGKDAGSGAASDKSQTGSTNN